jgi:hypothetical protein
MTTRRQSKIALESATPASPKLQSTHPSGSSSNSVETSDGPLPAATNATPPAVKKKSASPQSTASTPSPRKGQASKKALSQTPDTTSKDEPSPLATPTTPAIAEPLSGSNTPTGAAAAVGRLRVVDSERPLLRAQRRVAEILKEYDRQTAAGCFITPEGVRVAKELLLVHDDLQLALGKKAPSPDVYVLGTVGALAFVADREKQARLVFRPGRSGLLLWSSTAVVHVLVGHANGEESKIDPATAFEREALISCCQAHNPALSVRPEDAYYFEFSEPKTFAYLRICDTNTDATLTDNDVTVRDRSTQLPLRAPHADLRKKPLEFSSAAVDEEEGEEEDERTSGTPSMCIIQ